MQLVDDDLRNYLESLLIRVPDYIKEGLLSVFCVGVVLLLAFKGKKAAHGIFFLIFLEYVFLIFCSTVFFRLDKDVRSFDFTPFWSYGCPEMLVENIMNILVFVPVGLLLKCAFNRIMWWKTLLTGLSISFSIEVLQFISMRGFSEVDDLMHNTLGCMIGYGVFYMIVWFVRKFRSLFKLSCG